MARPRVPGRWLGEGGAGVPVSPSAGPQLETVGTLGRPAGLAPFLMDSSYVHVAFLFEETLAG